MPEASWNTPGHSGTGKAASNPLFTANPPEAGKPRARPKMLTTMARPAEPPSPKLRGTSKQPFVVVETRLTAAADARERVARVLQLILSSPSAAPAVSQASAPRQADGKSNPPASEAPDFPEECRHED